MLKIGMFFTIVYGFKAVTEKIFLSDVFFQSSSTKSKMILQDLDFYRKLFIYLIKKQLGYAIKCGTN